MPSSAYDPQPTTSLAVRGATSVVGTASTTGRHQSSRSRRYNRSHSGGTSYIPQNEFPWFSQSGDVEIVIRVNSGHENKYLLHRHTLTRCSGFFEASTSDAWSKAQDLPALPAAGAVNGDSTALTTTNGNKDLARIGEDSESERRIARPSLDDGPSPRKRWRYELDKGDSESDIPMLVQKEEAFDTRSSTTPSKSLFGGPPPARSSGSRKSHNHSAPHSFFRSVTNLGLTHTSSATSPSSYQPTLPPPTQAESDLLRDYDNLFRIMYNYPPVLDGINIADAYVQCKSLLTLADQYDALAVAGPRVDHHLLQFQSRLWKQIAKYPISYLRLGYLARSRIIFQEALIHVVGQWPAGERSLRAALPDTVLEIIEDKVDELEEKVSRIEGKLFRLSLYTRSGERIAAATGYLDWLAVSFFRQWIADATSPAPPPLPPPSPGDRHRRLGSRDDGNYSRSSRNNHLAVIPSSTLPPPTPIFPSLGRTFRTIGGLNSIPYLGHDECKKFLKLTPELYSRDNLRRFEKRIEELKGMARDIVRPLMGSGLELDLSPATTSGTKAGEAIGYLTCTVVHDRDLPWAVDD